METYVVTRGDTELGRLWHEWTEDGAHAWGYSDDFDPAAKERIERVIADSDAFDRQAGVLRTDAPNPLISRADSGWFGLLVVPSLLREGYRLQETERATDDG